MMTTEALTMALEALEEATTYTSSASFSPSMTRDCEKAIAAIKAVLAQPAAQAEPVFWGIQFNAGVYAGYAYPHKRTAEQLSAVSNQPNTVVPLYTTPQPAHQKLQRIANEQAEDEALWCDARTIFESMLQEALRRLHAAIESTSQPAPYITELIDRLRDKTDIIPDMTVRQANAHLVCLCNDAADALEAAHGTKEQ